MDDLVKKVRTAGVVGAGGAGFPAYKKIDARVEYIIANGSECEPLLSKDRALMEHYAEEIVQGIRLLMEWCSAQQGIIAIKSKNQQAIKEFERFTGGDIKINPMEDVYPAGDEYEVVYFCTGRRIPPGGIPLQIGVVVQNVETLYNIHRASRGYPVTHSMVSVNGEVSKPFSGWIPIGTSFEQLLDWAGGVTVKDFCILDGGPMMGKVVKDLSTPVTKTTSGLIVVPAESWIVRRKSQTENTFKRIGKSACDQCSDCTEMCPRYLLGYPIKPHLVMRSLLTSSPMSESLSPWAQLCCECNVCSLWACPEELNPRDVCIATKRNLKANETWLPSEKLEKLMLPVHPMRDYRKISTKKLTRRLGLEKYPQTVPFRDEQFIPERVKIPLLQNIGARAKPILKVGDEVLLGDVLAVPDEEQLGVPIHASINGRIKEITAEFITIEQF